MKSDRELLELAEEAAGMKIHTKNQAERDEMGFGGKGLWIVGGSSGWNPLTDDGDALRLAAELGLVVCVMRNAGFTGVYLPACSIGGKYDEVQHHGESMLAATRLAIVRAAASIGEGMK